MSNYHEVMQWHKQNDNSLIQEDDTDGEASYNRKYVTQKLNHGLHRIWKVKRCSLNNRNFINNVLCNCILSTIKSRFHSVVGMSA